MKRFLSGLAALALAAVATLAGLLYFYNGKSHPSRHFGIRDRADID
jgi:hypothetical protein